MKKPKPFNPQMKPRWGALYDRFFPEHTDPSSRHTRMIAMDLRQKSSPIRKLLEANGHDPVHWAGSLEITVQSLWRAREENAWLRHQLAHPKDMRSGGDA